MDEVFRRTQRRGVEEDGAAAQPSGCRIGGGRGHLGRHTVSLADAGLGPHGDYCRMPRMGLGRGRYRQICSGSGNNRAERGRPG